VVALVAQDLDTCQDGLLDLIMGRAGGLAGSSFWPAKQVVSTGSPNQK